MYCLRVRGQVKSSQTRDTGARPVYRGRDATTRLYRQAMNGTLVIGAATHRHTQSHKTFSPSWACHPTHTSRVSVRHYAARLLLLLGQPLRRACVLPQSLRLLAPLRKGPGGVGRLRPAGEGRGATGIEMAMVGSRKSLETLGRVSEESRKSPGRVPTCSRYCRSASA